MFKKINFKSILIGLIIGVVLSSSVFADISSIQVLFNDIKVSLDNVMLDMKDAKGNPVQPLVYNGTTYLPVRALCEALNKDIKMNEITNTLEITTRVTATNTVGKEENVLSESVISNYLTYEENGLIIREVDNEKFIEVTSVQNKLKGTKYNLFDYVSGSCKLQEIKNDKLIDIAEINAYSNSIQPYKPYKNEFFIGSGAFKLYIKYEDYINIIQSVIGE